MCVSVCNANIMSRHCTWKKYARDFFPVLCLFPYVRKKKEEEETVIYNLAFVYF